MNLSTPPGEIITEEAEEANNLSADKNEHRKSEMTATTINQPC
jgi:hypothetical protein